MTTAAEPTEAQWAVIEAVYSALPDTPMSPSKIARRAHVTTGEAHYALEHLLERVEVRSVGNGCWTNYVRRGL